MYNGGIELLSKVISGYDSDCRWRVDVAKYIVWKAYTKYVIVKGSSFVRSMTELYDISKLCANKELRELLDALKDGNVVCDAVSDDYKLIFGDVRMTRFTEYIYDCFAGQIYDIRSSSGIQAAVRKCIDAATYNNLEMTQELLITITCGFETLRNLYNEKSYRSLQLVSENPVRFEMEIPSATAGIREAWYNVSVDRMFVDKLERELFYRSPYPAKMAEFVARVYVADMSSDYMFNESDFTYYSMLATFQTYSRLPDIESIALCMLNAAQESVSFKECINRTDVNLYGNDCSDIVTRKVSDCTSLHDLSDVCEFIRLTDAYSPEEQFKVFLYYGVTAVRNILLHKEVDSVTIRSIPPAEVCATFKEEYTYEEKVV